MLKWIGKIGWLCAVLPLAAISLCAQTPTAASIAAKVDARYDHMASLQAEFSEHFSGLNLDRTETGTLWMKKPGRMRWSYSSPAGKVFVLDGKNAWFYSPGDAQAQHIPAKKLDDLRSPMRYLLGHTHLEKEMPGLALAALAGGNYRLTGIPKGMEQSVRLVTLDVTGDGLLLAIRVEDSDGTVTEFRFTGMRENGPMKDADFLFTPPAGVTVVESLPPI
jgi:outer membrane lipoprotein carrier protein